MLRWVLLVCFVAYGVYLLLWAFQSAMFSVPSEPFEKAIYETRALVFFPLSIVMVANGMLFFLLLKEKE